MEIIFVPQLFRDPSFSRQEEPTGYYCQKSLCSRGVQMVSIEYPDRSFIR